MKKVIVSIVAMFVVMTMVFCFVACDNTTTSDSTGKTIGLEDFTNPGDNLGGGGTVSGDLPESEDTTDVTKMAETLDVVVESEDTTEYADSEYTEVDLSTLAEDYSISKSGNYVFTGTTTYKIVLAKKDTAIHIWLNNATLDSIFSDKKPTSTTITLVGDNTMTGVSSDANDDAKGTLYVKNDLLINGNGNLTIASSNKNGIHATGKLKIESTLTINAYNHAVRGNDAVILDGATIVANAQTGDGIQTDNETDDATIGYIYIDNSNLTIVAGDDGISAATTLYVKSGNINITTNGGAPSRITETSSDNASGKGIKAGTIKYAVEDSNLETELAKGNREDTKEDDEEGVSIVEITDASYYSIVIEGGTFTLNCNDDAIHSNGSMIISGGTYSIATGDDAIHSESILKISAGTIDITKCYEGIESAKIEISGGDITVVASDDGVNAADGTTTRVGVANTNCYMIISGGILQINATGDGLDSNGYLYITGGQVYVDGPTSGANSALDSDGGIVINGGTVVAVGSIGMVETPSQSSAQCSVSYAVNSSISAGSVITLKDASGNTVVTFTTAKACQSIIMSDSAITSGNTYSLYIGSTLAKTFTVSSTITSIGTQTGGNNMGGGQGWGFGGGRR